MRGVVPLPSILLVEDCPEDVELTRLALGQVGVRVPLAVAEDGATALRRLATAEEPVPALVLLDLKLPGVDGLAVLREMRAQERTRRVPVVVLTSSDAERDIHGAYGAGANGYVVKPLSFRAFRAALVDIVDAWIDGGEGGAPRAAEAVRAARGEVLVVLGDPGERARAAAIVRSLGVDTVLLADGVASARRLLAEHGERVRHVLVDARLPDGTGAELTVAVRAASGRSVTVVVVADAPTGPEARASLDAGANGVAAKPRDAAALDARLRALGRFWLVWNRRPRAAHEPPVRAAGPG